MSTLEPSRIVWGRALLGMVVTCVVALSVHVVMLQVLNVPYPAGNPASGWPVFCNWTVSALGTICLDRLLMDRWAGRSILGRCLLLFLLVATLRESLLRVFLMNGFVTTAWRYAFVASLPRLVLLLILCVLVVLAAGKLARPWQQVLGALLIAAALTFLCLPPVTAAFDRLLAAIEYLNHDALYDPPYGWQVEVPAYITFLEPVVACFVMAALVWDKLPGDGFARTWWFTLLVLAVSGKLILPITYAASSSFVVPLALLSMGQFFLEVLALALLTAWTWRFCQPRLVAA